MHKALLSKLPGSALIALGLIVILGWLLHLPALVQVVPGFVGMVFNTALCFLLAGIALLLPDHHPRLQHIGQSLIGGFLVIMGGVISI